jgi:selenium-binding protein 1
MAQPTIDPTFYRNAAEAAAAPGEELAYVVAFDRAAQKNDAMTVIDVNPASDTYGQVVGWTDVPALADELHHFGWNACSSALKHEGHDMEGLARRYLLVPGLRSSNIYVLDIASDPRKPTLVKTIDGETLSAQAGPALTPCTAGPTGSSSPASAAPRGTTTGRAGSPCSTTKRSTSHARGRPTAGRSTSTTTPSGTSTRTC